ncbi:Heat shock protein 12A [Hypsizygus marmoreus]|uniref:Heat shock protein 12A n=1 Tax=Hypsizygus marmoreus TaxID=39966 RepID=A0A369JLX5_HYPMA|nr:Heat shock protein 12A [Hypsizygus marmoreus]
MTSSQKPYTGSSRKLVLAFDVGTTYSGVSYSVLNPGQVPEIKAVTRFPAQEEVKGYSKIPTIIYYDPAGNVRAVGAEATQESIEDRIKDEGWIKAEWFKLQMRPTAISDPTSLSALPQLPANKPLVDLLADFLGYLYVCAKNYIVQEHGAELWSSVKPNIEFVLTHPNGWKSAQHQQMLKASVVAGLIPDTPQGHRRLHLVTEGEANLLLCLQSGLTIEGDGVIIVDAGGGTIDVSTYGQVAMNDSVFEEIAPPECHLQGSALVTMRARKFFEDRLRGSKFFDQVDAMTQIFDKASKLTFTTSESPLFIKVGSARERDPSLGIRGGQLKLSGMDVANFFQPSISRIIEAIKAEHSSAGKRVSTVFLVGGFAASQWLFSQLKAALEPSGLNLCRPDSHINKTVADGAVSFYLDRANSAPVSKPNPRVETPSPPSRNPEGPPSGLIVAVVGFTLYGVFRLIRVAASLVS